MDMVERVARALAMDQWPEHNWPADFSEREAEDYRGHARAAIEAMREPTEAMLAAGFGDASPTIWTAGITPEDQRNVWQAMIDSTLKAQSPETGGE
jgi:hypothetical protein